MGRRECSALEKQLVGTELGGPMHEIEKEETKWLVSAAVIDPTVMVEHN